MDKRIIAAAVRFLAPSVLAVGTLLVSAPAFAGGTEAQLEKTPLPTAASRHLEASVHSVRGSTNFRSARSYLGGAQSSHQTSRASTSSMRSPRLGLNR